MGILLEPGDILLARHKGAFLSGAIRRFESMGDGGKPSLASHSGLITRPGIELDASATEALASGVVEQKLSVGYANLKEEFCVFRPINLTEAQKRVIVIKAQGYIGKKYGFAKLLAHAADNCLGGMNLFRRLCRLDRYPICSYVVGAAFASEGLDFGINYRAVDPDDITDFCLSNPDKYQFIFQRGQMVAA